MSNQMFCQLHIEELISVPPQNTAFLHVWLACIADADGGAGSVGRRSSMFGVLTRRQLVQSHIRQRLWGSYELAVGALGLITGAHNS